MIAACEACRPASVSDLANQRTVDVLLVRLNHRVGLERHVHVESRITGCHRLTLSSSRGVELLLIAGGAARGRRPRKV
jgi:hypothetical protein